MVSRPQLLNRILDAVFPPLCLHCQREGAWLCSNAVAQLTKIQPLFDPLPIDDVDRVLCVGSYDHPLIGKLVTRMKYGGFTAYREVVRVMLTNISLGNDGSLIIPVPLHATRQRARGFNQSRVIAEELASLLTTRTADLVHRARATHTQTSLTESARRHNVERAFRLARWVETVPERGILVDDVITTGSTIRECASVLRKAGMKQITAVALAKG